MISMFGEHFYILQGPAVCYKIRCTGMMPNLKTMSGECMKMFMKDLSSNQNVILTGSNCQGYITLVIFPPNEITCRTIMLPCIFCNGVVSLHFASMIVLYQLAFIVIIVWLSENPVIIELVCELPSSCTKGILDGRTLWFRKYQTSHAWSVQENVYCIELWFIEILLFLIGSPFFHGTYVAYLFISGKILGFSILYLIYPAAWFHYIYSLFCYWHNFFNSTSFSSCWLHFPQTWVCWHKY